VITRTDANSDMPHRVELGAHRPVWETGECPSCGSAPCGPHPDFAICRECEEDWPCQTVQATADELDRIAAITHEAAQNFDTAHLAVRKDDHLTFARTLKVRADALRGEES
jgi:hypothetical protein